MSSNLSINSKIICSNYRNTKALGTIILRINLATKKCIKTYGLSIVNNLLGSFFFSLIFFLGLTLFFVQKYVFPIVTNY